MTKNENLTAWVIELIDNFLARSPLNNLQNQGKDPAWEAYENKELPPPPLA